MKKQHLYLSSAVLAVAAGLGLSIALDTPEADAAQVPVQMLGINDFHGALDNPGSFYDGDGKKTANSGGAAMLAGYLNKAQSDFKTATNGETIRVQAGDMVGASPASSGLLQDEPTINVLNEMNFTVGTLGNHEFDEGLPEYKRILDGVKPAPDQFPEKIQEILNNYPQEKSKMDIVVANVVNKSDGSIPEGFKPYTVKEIGGVKVGYIGIVTTEIPNLVLKDHIKDFNFLNESETIAKYSRELQEKEGVKAIVVLAHTPMATKNDGTWLDDTSEKIMEKVDAIYPQNSVDVYFGGHNHKYANGTDGKRRYVESTSNGRGYIDLQGKLDTDTKDFTAVPTATVNPVAPKNDAITPDPAVAATVKQAQDLIKPITEASIGKATTEDAKNGMITRDVNDNVQKESPVGNMITDGQVYMSKKAGLNADFAMTNNGGIRSDLAVGSNAEITWGSAQAVQPFGNIMQVIDMTGKDIENVLNQQYDDDLYFLQISGLRYDFKANTGADKDKQKYVVTYMEKADGTPIKADQTYKVVINDFLFGGGDGFSGFVGKHLVGAMDPDTETFVNYITDKTAEAGYVTGKVEGRKHLAIENGWAQIGDNWVYYKNSERQKGWLNLNGTYYYLNPESGVMQTGWQLINGAWYYLGAANDGAMKSGWQSINGTWYYLGAANDGAMKTGWQFINNNWFYLNASGAMQAGWVNVSGTWYYMNSYGSMTTGWQYIGGSWYYMNKSGAMQTGWLKLGNTWYYLENSGVMHTGWLNLGGTWYFLNTSGSMQTGWYQIGPTWYYFNNSGAWVR